MTLTSVCDSSPWTRLMWHDPPPSWLHRKKANEKNRAEREARDVSALSPSVTPCPGAGGPAGGDGGGGGAVGEAPDAGVLGGPRPNGELHGIAIVHRMQVDCSTRSKKPIAILILIANDSSYNAFIRSVIVRPIGFYFTHHSYLISSCHFYPVCRHFSSSRGHGRRSFPSLFFRRLSFALPLLRLLSRSVVVRFLSVDRLLCPAVQGGRDEGGSRLPGRGRRQVAQLHLLREDPPRADLAGHGRHRRLRLLVAEVGARPQMAVGVRAATWEGSPRSRQGLRVRAAAASEGLEVARGGVVAGLLFGVVLEPLG